jgi:hypothetical protein
VEGVGGPTPISGGGVARAQGAHRWVRCAGVRATPPRKAHASVSNIARQPRLRPTAELQDTARSPLRPWRRSGGCGGSHLPGRAFAPPTWPSGAPSPGPPRELPPRRIRHMLVMDGDCRAGPGKEENISLRWGRSCEKRGVWNGVGRHGRWEGICDASDFSLVIRTFYP